MDFFRKYQRVILYTAGIFALVSFSISAPILGFVDSLFRNQIPTPTMRIGERIVSVTAEDLQVASRLAMRERLDPAIVMPNFIDADQDRDRREIYAALRRLAIEFGIEASEDEVDRAIAQAIEVIPGVEGAADLARMTRSSSIADYRETLREGLRIATYVRVQALAADVSDAALVEGLLGDVELLVVEVATLDAEDLQKELEATDVSDEDLTTWIEGLESFDKRARGFLSDAKYHLQFALIDLAAFDPATFSAELGDKEFSDDEVANFYDMNRASLFVKPKDDEKKPDDQKDDEQKDDEQTPEEQNPAEAPSAEANQDPYLPLDDARKADIRKRLAAEAVLRTLWDQVTTAYGAWIEDAGNVVEASQIAVDEALSARDEARMRGEAADATDEEKAALADAETALEAARTAVTTAEEALKARRAEFDSRAAFEAVVAGRPGASVLDTGDEMKTVAEIGELEPIAPWRGAIAVREEQPLSTMMQRSKGAVFQMRWLGTMPDPLRPLEEIREKARADYFQDRADDLLQERADAFEESLIELAKSRVAAEITELETSRDQQVETRVEAWRTKLQAGLDEARTELEKIGSSDPNRRVYVRWKAAYDSLEAELTKEASQREAFLAEEQATIDEKIAKLAKENYAAVLAEAAAQHGFNVAEFGPLPRDLAQRRTPREAFPKPVRYLFFSGQLRETKTGEATDLLEDPTGRCRHLAVVKDVRKAQIGDITRRQLLEAREQGAPQRRAMAANQSFSLDALKRRFGWQAPSEAVAEPN